MKRKKLIFMITLICSISMLLCACAKSGDDYATLLEQKLGGFEYNTTDGEMYTDISGNFDFKVKSARIQSENTFIIIKYDVFIFNKTGETFENFYPRIILQDEMENFIATGQVQYTMQKNNVVPVDKVKANEVCAVNVSVNQMLLSYDKIKLLGYKFEQIYDYGENFKLELYWDGGSETYEFTTNVEAVEED